MAGPADGLSFFVDSGLAILFCMTILYICDLAGSRFLRDFRSYRWFFLHGIANLFTTIITIPAVLAWLADPLASGEAHWHEVWDWGKMLDPCSTWATYWVDAVHAYHVVFFFGELTSADWFHHGLFCPIVGVFGGLMNIHSACPIRNCIGFFMSGFPGGLNYLLLILVKTGRLNKLRQKRIDRWINLWVRGPGIVLVSFTIYLLIRYNAEMTIGHIVAGAIVAGFSAYNGVYYTEEAVANYYVRATEKKVAERAKKQ